MMQRTRRYPGRIRSPYTRDLAGEALLCCAPDGMSAAVPLHGRCQGPDGPGGRQRIDRLLARAPNELGTPKIELPRYQALCGDRRTC